MEEKLLLNFNEFYEQYKDSLGIGETNMRKLVKRKDFPKIMIGNQAKIVVSKIPEFLENHVGLKI